METNDKELFESAISDEPVTEAAAETPAEEATEQPRDEHGRFAPKAEQPEAQTETQQTQTEQAAPPQTQDATVPSWRLREEREAREAAERRFNEAQSNWQRQFQELQTRLPKQEPATPPDIFENPNEFVGQNVRQHVDPIKSEIGQLREFYSRRDAEREFGSEKVNAAYDALAQGMAKRDPEAFATYQRAMSSMHPFGDIVQWHQQRTVFGQIGADPQAWFSKELETRLSKDPAFQANLIQQIQKLQSPNPQRTNIVQLPPSLNRVAAAQGAADDDNDMSDQALFRHATR